MASGKRLFRCFGFFGEFISDMLCTISTVMHNRRKRTKDFLLMNLNTIDLDTCCGGMVV